MEGEVMARMTAAERVYREVYADIENEVRQPGDVVREDVLAKQYGLSRTPVREALRRLVQDGLCEKHGPSLRISRLTLDRVGEIYPIVSVLEGLAARLCAERLTPATLDRLESLHASMRTLSAAEDYRGYVAANQEFHEVILSASSNAALVATVARLRLVTLALRTYQLGVGDRMAQSCLEHGELMAAIRGRDASAAEASMRVHVDAGYALLVSALSSAALIEPVPRPSSTRTPDRFATRTSNDPRSRNDRSPHDHPVRPEGGPDRSVLVHGSVPMLGG